MSKDINRVIEDILERLQKIESKINVEKKPKTTKVTMEKFSGAKGGALLLISKGFFSKKRMIYKPRSTNQLLRLLRLQVLNCLQTVPKNKILIFIQEAAPKRRPFFLKQADILLTA